MANYDWDTHPRTWSSEQKEALLSSLDGEQPMDRDALPYKTWSHQFQGISCGHAVDSAILHWRTVVLKSDKTGPFAPQPDDVTAVGPFSPYMREEAINKYNNADGVWDITIRWYE